MKSIGDILKAQRQKRKLTIENINKAIKVHPKYVTALEENDYSVFDGKVHAKGFLKLYAEFLGLDVEEMLAIWRREYEADFDKVNKSLDYSFKPIEPVKFVVTPGIVLISVFLVLILGFFGYLFYQYKSFNGAPNLQITHPAHNQPLEVNIVDVIGKTDLDAQVYVNNQRVMLDKEGNFATSVSLNEGLNTLSIMAVNKLDKKTEDVRTVIYRAPQARQTPDTPESTASESAEVEIAQDLQDQEKTTELESVDF